MRILEFFLYILAAVVLIAALWIGISLMGSLAGTGMLSNFIMASILRSLFSTLGTAVIVIGLILSTMLFAVGRVVHTQLRLEQRIARLEAPGV